MPKKLEARNEVLQKCNEKAEELEKLYSNKNLDIKNFVPSEASVEDFLRSLFRIFGKKNRFIDFNVLCECYFIENNKEFSTVPLLAKSYFSLGEFSKCKKIIDDFFYFLNETQKLEVIEVLSNLADWPCVEKYIETFDTEKLNRGGVSKLHLLNKRLEKSGVKSVLNKTSILCLNLKDDIRKRKIIENVYSNIGVDVNIQEAIRGSCLDEAEVRRVNPNGKFWNQLGAVGCFLSHIEAIKKVAGGNAEYAIIIEDDGLPYYRFSDEEVEEVIKGNDVIFINNRMSSLVCGQVEYKGMTTVAERLSMLPDVRKGWGGDGYIISKLGAQKILENFSFDNIIGHFDGQLGSYCIDSMSSFEQKNKALSVAESFLKKFKEPNVIVGKTLNFPMIRTVNFSVSSRNIESEKNVILSSQL